MVRYKAILAYDGTDFKGFQRQKASRTVQGEVERALASIGWLGSTIYGAGRTDAGVHATGQVIAFDMDWGHSPEALQQALNANLPLDAAVREVRVVPSSFHPRYDALSRRYEYRLAFEPVRNPLVERYAWRIWPPLDMAELQAAAQVFVGSHDFAAFGTPQKSGGSSVRKVSSATWRALPNGALFTIEANAFLYHMVRRIVIAQVEAGRGTMAIDHLRHLVGAESSGQVLQGLAPAQGLTLTRVRYPDEPVSD